MDFVLGRSPALVPCSGSFPDLHENNYIRQFHLILVLTPIKEKEDFTFMYLHVRTKGVLLALQLVEHIARDEANIHN